MLEPFNTRLLRQVGESTLVAHTPNIISDLCFGNENCQLLGTTRSKHNLVTDEGKLMRPKCQLQFPIIPDCNGVVVKLELVQLDTEQETETIMKSPGLSKKGAPNAKGAIRRCQQQMDWIKATEELNTAYGAEPDKAMFVTMRNDGNQVVVQFDNGKDHTKALRWPLSSREPKHRSTFVMRCTAYGVFQDRTTKPVYSCRSVPFRVMGKRQPDQRKRTSNSPEGPRKKRRNQEQSKNNAMFSDQTARFNTTIREMQVLAARNTELRECLIGLIKYAEIAGVDCSQYRGLIQESASEPAAVLEDSDGVSF
jgi:hypothetical protein